LGFTSVVCLYCIKFKTSGYTFKRSHDADFDMG